MGGECKVDTIKPELLSQAVKTARTLEDVFSTLHILQNGDNTLAPPNRIDPQDPDLAGKYRDINADRWPYLAASRGGYNVTNLFTNGSNSDALNCALNALQYNEGQGKAVADQVAALRDRKESESAVQSYLGGLSATDQRNYEVYNTIRFMHQFDKGPDTLDKDGDFSVISREDLTNWAEGLGDDGQGQGEKAVVRLHVILGLVNYFSNPPSQALIPTPQPPPTGTRTVTNPDDAGSTGGGNKPSADKPADHSDADSNSWVVSKLLPLLGAFSLGGMGVYLLKRGRGKAPTSEGNAKRPLHPDAEAAIEREQNVDDGIPKPGATRTVTGPVTPPPATKATRVVLPDTPAAPPPLPTPAATPTVAAPDGDMADLAAALLTAGKDKSPLPGSSPSSPPATTGITADNVIIRGKDAKPSAELNKNVVMAEISYLNPKFLTDDGSAIHSNYRAGVEQLADLAMQAFGDRGANAPSPTELWRMEHGKHDTMVRGGIPESWLREFVSNQLEKWHAAGAPGMNFDATVRESMERDSERRAGERSLYEKFVEDFLRDPSKR